MPQQWKDGDTIENEQGQRMVYSGGRWNPVDRTTLPTQDPPGPTSGLWDRIKGGAEKELSADIPGLALIPGGGVVEGAMEAPAAAETLASRVGPYAARAVGAVGDAWGAIPWGRMAGAGAGAYGGAKVGRREGGLPGAVIGGVTGGIAGWKGAGKAEEYEPLVKKILTRYAGQEAPTATDIYTLERAAREGGMASAAGGAPAWEAQAYSPSGLKLVRKIQQTQQR